LRYHIYIIQNNIDARERAINVINPVPPIIPDTTIDALDALVVADTMVWDDDRVGELTDFEVTLEFLEGEADETAMDEMEVIVEFPETMRPVGAVVLSEMRLSVRRLSGRVVVFMAAEVLPPVVAEPETAALEMLKKWL
jgi:hypothetical protein